MQLLPPDPVVDPTGITVRPQTNNLTVGDERQLTIEVEPEGAEYSSASWGVEFPDGNQTISLSDDGYVTALAAGQAYVIATTDKGLTSQATVDVNEPEPPTPEARRIFFEDLIVDMAIGDSIPLPITAEPEGSTYTISSVDVLTIESTTGGDVITVSDNSTLVAVSGGIAILDVYTTSGLYASTEVHVLPSETTPSMMTLSILPTPESDDGVPDDADKATIEPMSSRVMLRPFVLPQSETEQPAEPVEETPDEPTPEQPAEPSQPVTETPEQPPVTSEPTPAPQPTPEPTQPTDSLPPDTAEKVEDALEQATGISIKPKTNNLTVGAGRQLKVELTSGGLGDALTQLLGGTGETIESIVSWTSSDPKIVTVKDGYIQAVAKGKVTITVATANGLKSTASVTVA